MINVQFHQALARKFGRAPIRLSVKTPAMMFRGLEANLPDFAQTLRKLADKGQRLSIVCVDERTGQGRTFDPALMQLPFSCVTTVHIVPEVTGSGTGIEFLAAYLVEMGVSAVVANAIAYIAVNVAVSLVLGAVAQALAPSPDTSGNGNEKPEERGSLIFNGPVNTIGQGGCIPIVYGQCITGSVVISAGVAVEEIPV